MDKALLRSKYISIRKKISIKEKAGFDEKIAFNLFNSTEYSSCENILIYVSKDIEVDTKRILCRAFTEKRVFCPRCRKDSLEMDFFRVRDFSDLKCGMYGISEPVDMSEIFEDLDNSLCVVPGLAYDIRGYRLGFGRGYYDRFLDGFKGTSVGLCYKNCVCEELPVNNTDIKVDKLITEQKGS